jgi:predicted porin
LENQFSTDTGAQGGTQLFTRGAWVQLDQANVGSVTLGRQNGLDYVNVIAGDAFGAANIGGFIPVAYNGSGVNSSSYNRHDNAITLQSANFAGFTVAYQYAMGEQAGDTSKLKNEAFRITYTYGKLNLSAASRERKDANGAKVETVSNYFANYDFGVAKGFLGYQENDPASGVKVKATSVGVVVPVNAKVNVMAAYHNVENSYGVNGGDAKAYGLGATYALSKRTTLYALHGSTDVDATGKLASGSTYTVGTVGKDNTMTAVGIRHTF